MKTLFPVNRFFKVMAWLIASDVVIPIAALAQGHSDTIFHANHKPQEIIQYDKSDHRINRKLFFDTGEMMYEEIYKPGYYNFDAKGVYKNGKMEFVRHYEEDLAEGHARGWYDTGEVEYDEDCIHDTCTKVFYYPSGKIKTRKSTIHGRMITEENYCENGQLIDKVFADSSFYAYTKYYCNGKIYFKGSMRYSIGVGKWHQYYESGILALEGEYSTNDDLRFVAVGEMKEYNAKGQLTRITRYNDTGDEVEKKEMPLK